LEILNVSIYVIFDVRNLKNTKNRFLKLTVASVYGAAFLGGRFNQFGVWDQDSQARHHASLPCIICPGKTASMKNVPLGPVQYLMILIVWYGKKK